MITYRSFRGCSTAALALLFSIASVGQTSSPADGPPGPGPTTVRYRPVSGWPVLPPDVQLAAVSAVATDSAGNVFVLHRGKHPVLCFDANGKFLRYWGDEFITLGHGLRVDQQGFVWVTDLTHHQVYKFTKDGDLVLTLGTKDSSGDRLDQFNQPTDVAVTKTGDFYISDGYGNRRILKFDRSGKLIRAWGHEGTGPGEFRTPHALCLDSKERLYVSDRANARIQIFDAHGKFLEEWHELPPFDGLTCAADDTVFVTTGRGNEILRLTSGGIVLEAYGGPRTTEWEIMNNISVPPGRFNVAHGVAIDPKGNLYVAEVRSRRVQKILRVREGK